jgi:hypothetical protein
MAPRRAGCLRSILRNEQAGHCSSLRTNIELKNSMSEPGFSEFLLCEIQNLLHPDIIVDSGSDK